MKKSNKSKTIVFSVAFAMLLSLLPYSVSATESNEMEPVQPIIEVQNIEEAIEQEETTQDTDVETNMESENEIVVENEVEDHQEVSESSIQEDSMNNETFEETKVIEQQDESLERAELQQTIISNPYIIEDKKYIKNFVLQMDGKTCSLNDLTIDQEIDVTSNFGMMVTFNIWANDQIEDAQVSNYITGRTGVEKGQVFRFAIPKTFQKLSGREIDKKDWSGELKDLNYEGKVGLYRVVQVDDQQLLEFTFTNEYVDYYDGHIKNTTISLDGEFNLDEIHNSNDGVIFIGPLKINVIFKPINIQNKLTVKKKFAYNNQEGVYLIHDRKDYPISNNLSWNIVIVAPKDNDTVMRNVIVTDVIPNLKIKEDTIDNFRAKRGIVESSGSSYYIDVEEVEFKEEYLGGIEDNFVTKKSYNIGSLYPGEYVELEFQAHFDTDEIDRLIQEKLDRGEEINYTDDTIIMTNGAIVYTVNGGIKTVASDTAEGRLKGSYDVNKKVLSVDYDKLEAKFEIEIHARYSNPFTIRNLPFKDETELFFRGNWTNEPATFDEYVKSIDYDLPDQIQKVKIEEKKDRKTFYGNVTELKPDETLKMYVTIHLDGSKILPKSDICYNESIGARTYSFRNQIWVNDDEKIPYTYYEEASATAEFVYSAGIQLTEEKPVENSIRSYLLVLNKLDGNNSTIHNNLRPKGKIVLNGKEGNEIIRNDLELTYWFINDDKELVQDESKTRIFNLTDENVIQDGVNKYEIVLPEEEKEYEVHLRFKSIDRRAIDTDEEYAYIYADWLYESDGNQEFCYNTYLRNYVKIEDPFTDKHLSKKVISQDVNHKTTWETEIYTPLRIQEIKGKTHVDNYYDLLERTYQYLETEQMFTEEDMAKGNLIVSMYDEELSQYIIVPDDKYKIEWYNHAVAGYGNDAKAAYRLYPIDKNYPLNGSFEHPLKIRYTSHVSDKYIENFRQTYIMNTGQLNVYDHKGNGYSIEKRIHYWTNMQQGLYKYPAYRDGDIIYWHVVVNADNAPGCVNEKTGLEHNNSMIPYFFDTEIIEKIPNDQEFIGAYLWGDPELKPVVLENGKTYYKEKELHHYEWMPTGLDDAASIYGFEGWQDPSKISLNVKDKIYENDYTLVPIEIKNLTNHDDIDWIQIVIATKIKDPDYANGFKEGTFKNQVRYGIDENAPWFDAETHIEQYKMLEKNYKYDSGYNISFEIEVNPNSLDIFRDKQTIHVFDEYDKTLLPNLDSIKIKNVVTNEYLEFNGDDVSKSFKIDTSEYEDGKLILEIPDNQHLKISYDSRISTNLIAGQELNSSNIAYLGDIIDGSADGYGKVKLHLRSSGSVMSEPVVIIEKWGKSSKLSGSKFEVSYWDTQENKFIKLNEGKLKLHEGIDWKASFDDVDVLFKVVEIQSPEGYALLESPRYYYLKGYEALTNLPNGIQAEEVEYVESGDEIPIFNTKVVDLKIKKTDIKTNTLLKAKFTLHKAVMEGGRLIAKEAINLPKHKIDDPNTNVIETDVHKEITIGLLPGIYALMESEAPIGYAKKDTPIFFEVKEDGSCTNLSGTQNFFDFDENSKSLTIKNKKISTDFEIYKFNEKNEPLDGASFKVVNQQDESNSIVGTTVGNKITFNGLLLNKTYNLIETTPLKGYTIMDPVELSVDDLGNVTFNESDVIKNEDGIVKVINKSILITIQKTFEGKDIKDVSKVSFDLYEDLTKVNTDSYTLTKEGNKYIFTLGSELNVNSTYTLKETSTVDGFVTVDAYKFRINNDGTIEEIAAVDGYKVSSDQHSILVTNKQSSITIKKIDGDGNPLEGVKFKLKDTDYEWTTDSTGEYTIKGLEVNKEYSIVELETKAGFVKLDEAIKFTIKQDGTIDCPYLENDVILIKNIYQCNGALELTAMKTIDDKPVSPQDKDKFSFVLRNGDGIELETVKNNEKGEVNFNAIAFTKEDCGKEFTYTIEEVNANDKKYKYDSRVYTIKVTPMDLGDGTIEVSPVYTIKDKEKDAIVFNNKTIKETLIPFYPPHYETPAPTPNTKETPWVIETPRISPDPTPKTENPKRKRDSVPNTSDAINLPLWYWMLFSSTTVSAGSYIMLRKRKDDE